MEIKFGRMVHLGYGKYWRSDDIVGLCPIEENRGPGRRTEVFVSIREEPMVASRGQDSILREMGTLEEEEFAAEEARSILSELLDELHDVPPVLRRSLEREARMDLDHWERRIRSLLNRAPTEEAPDKRQEDLFATEE